MVSIHTLYRALVWLPILVPAAVVFSFRALGLRPSTGVVAEVFLYSLVYGGIPYAVLALWASWWIGGQPETAIRRLMFRAPLLMVAVFVPVALVPGLAVGRFGPFVAVAMLGSAIIVPLGYAYVGLAILLRKCLGPQRL
jgi:hypothetical protein